MRGIFEWIGQAMCRHLLPRFNFPISQTLHNVGQVVASHPVAAFALVLVPLCALVAILAFHRLKRSAHLRWTASRALPAGRHREFFGDGYGPVHPV